MIQIFEIQSAQEMEQAFEIRRIVFVIGQQCAPDEEYDEYEKICRHFLAKYQGIQAGSFHQAQKLSSKHFKQSRHYECLENRQEG